VRARRIRELEKPAHEIGSTRRFFLMFFEAYWWSRSDRAVV